MKIKNLSKWTEDDYYPQRQKIKRTKPRKNDLDGLKISRTFKPTKK